MLTFLEWEITDEVDSIGIYSCKKAVLKTNPDIYVWFTTDVAVNAGPYIFSGLPGLIVKVNDLYKTITLLDVTFLTDNTELETALEKLDMSNKEESITLKEVLAKKENFKQMILAAK